MKLSVPTLLLLLFALNTSTAQNTVGLLTHNGLSAQEGYTLFYPAAQETMYLIDNCGRLVHEWNDTLYQPGNAVYLMDNGDVVRCGRRPGILNPAMERGGAGEMVDRRDWNGQLLWRYTYNDPLHRMHHDVAMLPNGNVLILAWELKTAAEAAQVGRDTTGSGGATVWPDHIIEVEPLGIDSGNVVWAWHAWDHLVQDLDPNLPGYGVIADHPERIDINYDPAQDSDWLHANSIDYNPDLDQILLSIPHLNEVWIIDHSTTTAEAAGSTGGNSGHGGDLLYRWGNPEAYGRGGLTDQTLFFQHDARWLGPGLNANDPDIGNILVFNNRAGGNYSAVDMFTPPVDPFGAYVLVPNQAYGPDSALWRYVAPNPQSLYSAGLSGAHKLPNGNFLICSGRTGWFFEIDSLEDVVWEYKIPLQQGQPVAQGTVLVPGQSVFRATKYPADHPFLVNTALPPIGYIELQPDTAFCGTIALPIAEAAKDIPVLLFPNPSTGLVRFTCSVGDRILVTDALGRRVHEQLAAGSLTNMDLSALPSGIYLVQAGNATGSLLLIQK